MFYTTSIPEKEKVRDTVGYGLHSLTMAVVYFYYLCMCVFIWHSEMVEFYFIGFSFTPWPARPPSVSLARRVSLSVQKLTHKIRMTVRTKESETTTTIAWGRLPCNYI